METIFDKRFLILFTILNRTLQQLGGFRPEDAEKCGKRPRANTHLKRNIGPSNR
jgi:hypothetical protein